MRLSSISKLINLATDFNMTDSKTLSQVRQDLRIKWYRSPIEIKTLRELSKPSDIEGFRMALGHLLLWFCSGMPVIHFIIKSFGCYSC